MSKTIVTSWVSWPIQELEEVFLYCWWERRGGLTLIISVKANAIASPSRTSNPTQLSPRIAGIGHRLAPMEPPPHHPAAGWQAGRLVAMGSDRISLILVPDWPSLISLVSWASLLWRQDGLGAARERG